MATSQNGWAVLDNDTTGRLPRLRKWIIPDAGGRHLILRDASAGFLLVHMATWFDARIERLDMGQWDEWGYAVRPIRGQTSGYSNHASGTAMDLNATRHPRGVATRKTFTTGQITAINKRLPVYQGTLAWGGNWKSVPPSFPAARSGSSA